MGPGLTNSESNLNFRVWILFDNLLNIPKFTCTALNTHTNIRGTSIHPPYVYGGGRTSWVEMFPVYSEFLKHQNENTETRNGEKHASIEQLHNFILKPYKYLEPIHKPCTINERTTIQMK